MGAIRIKKNKLTEIDQDKNLGQSQVTGNDVDNSSPKSDATLLTGDKPTGEPIENYSEDTDSDVVGAMNSLAKKCKDNAAQDNFKITVSELTKSGKSEFEYFKIESENPDKSYVVYRVDANVYYRRIKEFKQIIQNKKDLGNNLKKALTHEYKEIEKPLDKVSVINRDDCMFIIYAIFSAITGKSYSKTLLDHYNMAESCMIRKHNKLGTDGNIDKSVAAHDAKYGSASQQAFNQEVEDKQKKDGTVGALDQQQQESAEPQFKQKLPNVHTVNENWVNLTDLMEADLDNIIYEPGDRVLVKIHKEQDQTADFDYEDYGVVDDVKDSLEFGQLITVMCHGRTFNVLPKDIKPDYEHYMSARTNNILVRGELEINRKTRLTDKVENDKTDYSKDYKDLNDYRVECDIVVNGFKCNFDKCYANLKDISESLRDIKVVTESSDVSDTVSIENLKFSEDNWPYAVVVDGENDSDEPLQKIRINPVSYVEAEEDDLVDVLVKDEPTQMVKKKIKIIS